MKRDDSFLLDIAKAAKRIIAVAEPHTLDSFLRNTDVREITLWQFAVIGEAVRNMSEEFQHTHPDIPWRRIVDMRNRLVHGYRDIDLEEVWRTTQEDVPQLLKQIEPLIPPEDA